MNALPRAPEQAITSSCWDRNDFFRDHSSFPLLTDEVPDIQGGDLPYKEWELRFSPHGSEVIVVNYHNDPYPEEPTRTNVLRALGSDILIDSRELGPSYQTNKPSSKLGRLARGIAFVVAGLVAWNIWHEWKVTVPETQHARANIARIDPNTELLQKIEALQKDYKHIAQRLQVIQSEIQQVKFDLHEIENDRIPSKKIYRDGPIKLTSHTFWKYPNPLLATFEKNRNSPTPSMSKNKGELPSDLQNMKKIVELELLLLKKRWWEMPDITIPGDSLAKARPDQARKYYTEAIQILKTLREDSGKFSGKALKTVSA